MTEHDTDKLIKKEKVTPSKSALKAWPNIRVMDGKSFSLSLPTLASRLINVNPFPVQILSRTLNNPNQGLGQNHDTRYTSRDPWQIKRPRSLHGADIPLEKCCQWLAISLGLTTTS